MLDKIYVLIRFLAIVLAPNDANEIVIAPQSDKPSFVIRESGEWLNYSSGTPQKCTLEKDSQSPSGYTAKYWLTPKQAIKLSKDFTIPASVFEKAGGTSRVTQNKGDSATIVIESVDDGFNCSFEGVERQHVFVRWRRDKKE